MERLRIISDNIQYQNVIFKKVVLVVCLYYTEDIDKYVNYINRVPEFIHVYIYSSNDKCRSKIKELVQRNFVFIKEKKNRGRDISALLVEARDVITDSEVFGFIHDKKPNFEYLREDVDVWIKNLWDNMLHSPEYVKNVLQLFDDEKNLGIVAPPEGLGEYLSYYYDNTWHTNFENTIELAKMLDLNCRILKEKYPFSLGTVFWARTKALEKLLKYNWKYEDFPEEPLPIDGTISHAIERILGYVAIDSGYNCSKIMTDFYAEWLIEQSQYYMREMFKKIKDREHVFNMHQIITLDERETKIAHFCSSIDRIFIYGAGTYGRNMYSIIKSLNYKIEGFLVSEGKKTESTVNEIPVFEVEEIEDKVNIGIIVAVSYEYRGAIETVLQENGFEHFIYGY